MRNIIEKLLKGEGENHILPFYWQHGENEVTLRDYMRAIHQSGCGAVCVESRPHPDFCGEKWWQDMDVILDEARNRGMKVWILDDSHFPTGYANGAVNNAPQELCRQSIYLNERVLEWGASDVCIELSSLMTLPEMPMDMLTKYASMNMKPQRVFDDDRVLGLFAVRGDERVNLADNVVDGNIIWSKPDGDWTVQLVALTRNAGPHRNYINMMDAASCRLLIDAVYQPHYDHYKDDFGTTIAGFFSDEPELGNGLLYMQHNRMGTVQDLPWSTELERQLAQQLGDGWVSALPLLWQDGSKAARVRFIYMDLVSRLVSDCFSEPLGAWCRERGVMYIGHVIEDEGQHCRTASSLGHYFRALSGQDMSGIDDIGGQVLPGGEDEPTSNAMGRARGGEFYHYGLAALAASAASIEPRKSGRSMCEIFGNYGWNCGVKLQKYLADHFLVRGINNFVPHAFSAKTYPDPDCPPHFYAQGHNPLFRHFGKLIGYMNRVCNLTSGGHRVAPVAVLYHGESEWAGGAMPFETAARRLYDAQILFDVVPADLFVDPQRYNATLAAPLVVNTQQYAALVIPESQYITAATAAGIERLRAAGLLVYYVNSKPSATVPVDLTVPDCDILPLDALATELAQFKSVALEPACNRLRVLHYKLDDDMFMLVNEGDTPYHGDITLPVADAVYSYDVMDNRVYPLDSTACDGGTTVSLTVLPLHSKIIVTGCFDESLLCQPIIADGQPLLLGEWTRSLCRSIDHPNFGDAQGVSVPDNLADQLPDFAGFARYETTFDADGFDRAVLSIEDADEGVEVFCNGESIGLAIAPPMLFDLPIKAGTNRLTIEVATTLERENRGGDSLAARLLGDPPLNPTGLTGNVSVFGRRAT